MKKVYVLGAGFAAQAGVPTLNKFFSKVREKKDRTDKYELRKVCLEIEKRYPILFMEIGTDNLAV